MYLDFSLEPGAHLQQPIPESWNAFVYVLEGEGIFGRSKSSPVNAHHLLLLGSGDGLEAWNKSSKSLRFILVGGEPLCEPLVQFGPFVMNTQEEIDRTIDDFENYMNGFEKARHWRSESGLTLDFWFLFFILSESQLVHFGKEYGGIKQKRIVDILII